METKTKKVGWREWLPSWQSVGKIALYLVSLYLLQSWVAVPLVTYVLDTDFFSSESAAPADEETRQAAGIFCGDYLQQELSVEKVEFPFGQGKVWEMGDGRFLVQASALVTDSDALAHRVNYACYVKHTGGNAFDVDNWKLRGLDWRLAEQAQ